MTDINLAGKDYLTVNPKTIDDSKKIYRARMLEALRGLYPTPKDWPDDPNGIDSMLRKRFPALQHAVGTLMDWLPESEKPKLDRAWKTFHHAYHGKKISEQERKVYEQMGLDVPQTIVGNGMLFTHYLPIHNSGEQPPALPEHKYLFKRNVDALLAFGNPTTVYRYEGWLFEYDRRKPFGPWPLKRNYEPRARAGRKFYQMFGRFLKLTDLEQEQCSAEKND